MSTQAKFPTERLPVWNVLSEFFLDGSLDDSDRRRIAATLAKSPYTLPEIEEILRYEVYPACHHNLLRMAGDWGAFDQKGLAERIAPLCGKRPRRRMPLLHAWMFKRDWKKIQPMIDAIRKTK